MFTLQFPFLKDSPLLVSVYGLASFCVFHAGVYQLKYTLTSEETTSKLSSEDCGFLW